MASKAKKKRSATKKATAKKVSVKKATAKKGARKAGKRPVKKPATKKPVAKKAAAKTATAKKPCAKKPATKKAAPRNDRVVEAPPLAKTRAPQTPSVPRTVKPPPKDANLEMSEEILQFVDAIDTYRQVNCRPFPTWTEIFHVLRQLGYTRS